MASCLVRSKAALVTGRLYRHVVGVTSLNLRSRSSNPTQGHAWFAHASTQRQHRLYSVDASPSNDESLQPKEVLQQSNTQGTLSIENAVTLEDFNHAIAGCRPDRGHVKYIRSVLARMEEVGIKPNLETYDMCLGSLPKRNNSIMTQNLLDALWIKSSVQSDLAMEILCTMEDEGIIPETSTYGTLLEVFGRAGAPVQRCRRMVYWMRRFAFANPYRLMVVPEDPCEFSLAVLNRIGGKNCETAIVYKDDDSYIVATHKLSQQEEVERMCSSSNAWLRVEGPFQTWFDSERVNFYSLFLHCDTGQDNASEPLAISSCISEPGTPKFIKSWLNHMDSVYPGLTDNAPDLIIRFTTPNAKSTNEDDPTDDEGDEGDAHNNTNPPHKRTLDV
eukprot:m.263011 g.263011  ORF g.263011 m.263011 type:complete len:389 (+) comp48070_c0_seq1:200-1366(+)